MLRIVALCPTYRRRKQVENLLACFQAQTYQNKYLLICDDSGELSNQEGNNWSVVSVPLQPTLPAKYNLIARIFFEQHSADVLAVMEDDDIYFEDYLTNHNLAIQNHLWSFPSWCYEEAYRSEERRVG